MFGRGEPEPAPGPGEYWGSDQLAQAETLYERSDFRRGLAKAVKAIESWVKDRQQQQPACHRRSLAVIGHAPSGTSCVAAVMIRGMIIAIEGPSAAGKTSWIKTHHAATAVWEHWPSEPEPDRRIDPKGAARFWADANAWRWAQALKVESAEGMAVCDTDPFKLHYVWSLWAIGETSTAAWRADVELSRKAFAAGRLGLTDFAICAIPDPDELRRRMHTDSGRARRNFELHARLAEPLRAWYLAIDSLEPGRVRWMLPADGSLDQLLPLRPNRSDPRLFDKLLKALSRET